MNSREKKGWAIGVAAERALNGSTPEQQTPNDLLSKIDKTVKSSSFVPRCELGQAWESAVRTYEFDHPGQLVIGMVVINTHIERGNNANG